MELSIVIVNFRTNEVTKDCLESLKQNIKNVKYEIILIDNGSVQNNGRYFKEILPNLIYVFSGENIGFGMANNLGIKVATGKYILLLNSDTLLFDDCIEKCYRYMESKSSTDVGLLGCKLLNKDSSFQPSFYPFKNNTIANYFVSNNLLLRRLFKIDKRFIETNEILEVGDISGAFMFLRRSVVEDVGGFDPDFFLFCEETEWCRERISKKYKIVYYPKAAITHIGGGSAPRDIMYVQFKLSLALLWYKKGVLLYLIFLVGSIFNTLLNVLFLPFVNRNGRRILIIDLKCLFRLLPYYFTEVVKFKRGFACRSESLIYGKLRPFLK